MGDILSIEVFKNGSDEWILDWVQISCSTAETAHFDCGNSKIPKTGKTFFIDQGKNFDEIEKENLQQTEISHKVESEYNTILEGFVVTSDLQGAGTDARVRKIFNSFKFGLKISDVDTVWAWEDKRPPPINKHFSEFFSLSPIKLIYKNPNFKSV